MRSRLSFAHWADSVSPQVLQYVHPWSLGAGGWLMPVLYQAGPTLGTESLARAGNLTENVNHCENLRSMLHVT